MTLLWFEGFDNSGSATTSAAAEDYLTALGWTSNGTWGTTLGTSSTRFQYGRGWQFGPAGLPIRATKIINDNPKEGIIGFAFNARSDNLSNGGSVTFRSIGSTNYDHCFVEVTETCVVIGYNLHSSDTAWDTVESNPLTFLLDTWNFIEVAFLIDDSSGYLHVRINGAPVAAIDGVCTKSPHASAHDYSNGFEFENTGLAGFYIDDIYLVDLEGSTNNSYLDEVRVRTLNPDSAGDLTQWTPNGAASNWQAAANYNPASTTIYNSTSTVGAEDLYNLQPLINGNTIYGVQIKGSYLHDDAGFHSAQNVIKTNGVEYPGQTIVTAPMSYTNSYDLYETNPNTGVGWTQAECNSLQIGPKMVS